MGRPPLGAAAKSKVASVRITPAQEEALIDKYGTVSRALRALVATVPTKKRDQP